MTVLRLVKQPGEPARLIRVPRVRVAQVVMDYLGHGASAEGMARRHPYLHPAEVHAAMVRYFDHPAEIDEEIRAECNEVERLRVARPPSAFLVMRPPATRKA